MKSVLTAVTLTLALTACGGDGGGTGTNTPVAAANPNAGTIADTSSVKYASALQAFAETWTGVIFLFGTNDLLKTAGVTSACPQGGSASFAAPMETLNLCRLKYPGDELYTGMFSAIVAASANVTTVTSTAINGVRAYDPAQPNSLRYTFSSGSFGGSDTNTTGNDQLRLSSGSILVNIGASSIYSISQFNSLTTNDGVSLMVQSINPATKLFQTTKGVNSYDISATQTISILGDNNPSAGVLSIAYSSSSACTPLVVTFLPANQFSLACGGYSITKTWSDADYVAARAAARV